MIRRLLIAALTTVFVVTACAGGGGSKATPSTSTTAPDGPSVTDDPCAGIELLETDVGVTSDRLVVEVIADVGADDVGDRSKRAVDAVKAWANAVNDRGGLACREVEVREWDSLMSAAETAEGVEDACAEAVALVGTSALLMLDTHSLTTCPDSGFAALGIPDVAERAVEVPHQCAPVTFSVDGTSGSCPYPGGARSFTEMVGPLRYLRTLEPELRGAFVVRSETPAATDASMSAVRVAQAAGVVSSDGEVAGSRHERSEAANAVYALVEAAGTPLVYHDAHPDVLSELQERSADEDDSPVDLWLCTAACYTSSFPERDESDGTYVWLPHLPFEEATADSSLAAYVDAVGADDATTVGFGAWTAAATFEHVVEQIVQTQGHNSITRARILQALDERRGTPGASSVTTAYGPGYRLDQTPACFVMMQVVDGEFERAHPAAPGTLDCKPDNLFTAELTPEQLRPA